MEKRIRPASEDAVEINNMRSGNVPADGFSEDTLETPYCEEDNSAICFAILADLIPVTDPACWPAVVAVFDWDCKRKVFAGPRNA